MKVYKSYIGLDAAELGLALLGEMQAQEHFKHDVFWLIERADLAAKDESGFTALMHAAYQGSPEYISAMFNRAAGNDRLQRPVNVMAKNNDGDTALSITEKKIAFMKSSRRFAKEPQANRERLLALFNGIAETLRHHEDLLNGLVLRAEIAAPPKLQFKKRPPKNP